jgi:hypothetical protein
LEKFGDNVQWTQDNIISSSIITNKESCAKNLLLALSTTTIALPDYSVK